MNQFVKASASALLRHGVDITYKVVSNGTYNPSTGAVTNTETSNTYKTYPKHIKFSTFNHPDLIGKEGILFYFTPATGFTPKLTDIVVYNSENYVVQNIQSHFANGEIALYRILTIKG